MYETSYHRASSVDDAQSKMKAAEDGKFLGGGMTLIPTMKQRLAAPTDIIDLAHVGDMKGIKADGSGITIGGGVTHSEVADSADVKAAIPALSYLAGLIGDPHVRNRGTIGGSVANNDPAADYPSACLGLGATIITNQRQIAADDFFVGLFETALNEDEIITAIHFPKPAKAGYAKFPNPASRYAMAGVFVAETGGDVRVAVTGAGNDGVYRESALEAALGGSLSVGAIDGISLDASNMMADMHGSSEYRANLVKVMAKRAIEAA
jgi:carbon-monoxide dehydrogenase medium subunit